MIRLIQYSKWWIKLTTLKILKFKKFFKKGIYKFKHVC
jgi:hypothetical protein